LRSFKTCDSHTPVVKSTLRVADRRRRLHYQQMCGFNDLVIASSDKAARSLHQNT